LIDVIYRTGDILLSINNQSVLGMTAEKAELLLKNLPRGPFRLTVTTPFKDMTKEHLTSADPHAASNLVSNVVDSDQNSNVADQTFNVVDRASNVADQASNSADQVSNVAAHASNAGTRGEKEGIIEATLQCNQNSSLGFEIEGGSDTSLNYVYIKSLEHHSPALTCGRFSVGDQLVMVGDTCLIGMTHAQAQKALNSTAATVEIVAQRKVPQLLTNPPEFQQSLTSDDPGSCEDLAVNTAGNESVVLETTGSTEDLVGSIRNTNEKKTSLITEERMTVELTRGPGEKLGIGIVGGTDNPNLRHVHVSMSLQWIME
jgi:C-terminal processing protease CtpA/Prc